VTSTSAIRAFIAPLDWVRIRCEQLFFSGASARELGLHRVLFFGLVLTYSLTMDPSAWASVSRVFWSPTYFFSYFEYPVASAGTLVALTWIWRAALLASLLGLFSRVSVVVAFVLGFYLIGLPHNFGKVHHNDAILVLVMAIFAFSRCGDGLSLDALRRTGRAPEAAEPDEGAWGGEYSWPLRLCRLMVVFVVFSAGVAKLRHGGLDWAVSDNLYYTILRHYYTHEPFTHIGLLFTRFPWMCNALAGFSLLVEISAPLLLVLRGWWRLILLAMVVGMFLGFGFTLGVLFIHYVALLLIFFVPWAEIIETPRAAPPQLGR
jgi:hypothetical protein